MLPMSEITAISLQKLAVTSGKHIKPGPLVFTWQHLCEVML